MKLSLIWRGGEHEFDLRVEHLRALQDRCDAGPPVIADRLGARQWRVEDVTETIRLGLESAGMEKREARRLVEMHVEPNLEQCAAYARLIIAAALVGDPDDPVGDYSGEAHRERQAPSPSPTENGASQGSTATA